MAGQIWSINDEGGYLYSPNLSEYLRLQNLPLVKFRQLCDVIENDADGKPLLGKGRGDAYYWNVFSKLRNKGRAVDETERLPSGGFKVQQLSGKIQEFGQEVEYTGKLDDLSAQPIKAIIDKVLKIDVAETFDIAAWSQFNQTPLRVAPTSATAVTAFSTGGFTSTVNAFAMGKAHIEPIVTQMKELNIPAYEEGDYVAIGRPKTFITLKSDLEGIQTYSESGLVMIKNGETGRYRGVRFVEQTHVPQGGAYSAANTLSASGALFNPQTETAAPWTNGVSDWCFFMGADTVSEAIAVPEEIRGKIPENYGRMKGFAWYALEGFGLSHTVAADARIVKWDSAN
jgi:N4-gp56 family major capsid protein